MIGKGREKTKNDLRQSSYSLVHRESAMDHKWQGHEAKELPLDTPHLSSLAVDLGVGRGSRNSVFGPSSQQRAMVCGRGQLWALK